MYPPIRSHHTEYLEVGGGHTLYLEESGRRDGLPVVFLHGGPGVGCAPIHSQFFDPEKYRIILFDQRGAGKSRPHAGLENNTTQDLVEDIERLRQHLGVEQWVVFGGSWGSSLALAYAEAYPQYVKGLILRGIFLCRDEDVRWFYQEGASRLFPDYWQDFLAPIAEEERGDMVSAYYKRLTGEDELARLRAAEAWCVWEGRTSTLRSSRSADAHFSAPFLALAMARIECHYFMHNAFMQPNQLLENASALQGIPGDIIHGRYDVICPVDQAYALSAAWPEAELVVVPEAGHSAFEEGNAKALLEATDRMAARFQ